MTTAEGGGGAKKRARGVGAGREHSSQHIRVIYSKALPSVRRHQGKRVEGGNGSISPC